VQHASRAERPAGDRSSHIVDVMYGMGGGLDIGDRERRSEAKVNSTVFDITRWASTPALRNSCNTATP
jgi:hypothetical protein